jgi:hypothetical protein
MFSVAARQAAPAVFIPYLTVESSGHSANLIAAVDAAM